MNRNKQTLASRRSQQVCFSRSPSNESTNEKPKKKEKNSAAKNHKGTITRLIPRILSSDNSYIHHPKISKLLEEKFEGKESSLENFRKHVSTTFSGKVIKGRSESAKVSTAKAVHDSFHYLPDEDDENVKTYKEVLRELIPIILDEEFFMSLLINNEINSNEKIKTDMFLNLDTIKKVFLSEKPIKRSDKFINSTEEQIRKLFPKKEDEVVACPEPSKPVENNIPDEFFNNDLPPNEENPDQNNKEFVDEYQPHSNPLKENMKSFRREHQEDFEVYEPAIYKQSFGANYTDLTDFHSKDYSEFDFVKRYPVGNHQDVLDSTDLNFIGEYSAEISSSRETATRWEKFLKQF